MYCGDETGAFIGEIGSHTARFGYGGQDAPRYVVNSLVMESEGSDQDKTKMMKKKYIPTSCYKAPPCTSSLKFPVRRVESPDPQQPVTDPVQFLQQGDSIANDWDAFEHVWTNAMDALHVKDTLKHTVGRTTSATAETTTTAASGLQSATLRAEKAASESKVVHPILVVAPGCTYSVNSSNNSGNGQQKHKNKKELLQLTELMMETLEAGALFVAPAPQLAAFAHGRQTSLVVDLGAGGCRVTPVVDGLVLKQAQRRTGRGGDWLGHCQWQALLQEKSVLRPRYQLAANYHSNSNNNRTTATTMSPNSNGLFHRWAMQDLMYELRSSESKCPEWWYDPSVPFLYKDEEEEEEEDGNDDSKDGSDDDDEDSDDDKMQVDSGKEAKHYELPDGTLVDLSGNRVGRDLTRVPELWFTDECPFPDNSHTAASSSTADILQQHPTLSNLPLHQLIHDSLAAVADVDIRKDLAGSILLTGGCAVTPNLEKRLSLELSRTVSSAYKPKVVASKFDVERQCAAWIGASVLTSLGSFQQLWLSKTEYDEYGGTLAIQRFP